jgi:hypothetical protein
MAASVKSSFGLGGGTSKTRLVADLNDEYKKLNITLKETEKLSKSISGSLQNSGKKRRGGGASSMSEPSEPPEPGEPGGPGGPGGPRGASASGSSASSFSSAVKTMAGAALTALATGVDGEQYITNDIARRRFGFYSGVYSRQNDNIGTIAGMKAFASMSSRGTPTSAMDAANATMAGNSMGLMSGLKNYNTIINSTAGISNVMPGVGLEGGMNAVSALNQGSSINKLRMIGINVRDQNGFMRNVEDIARDLWRSLNGSKSGTAKITEADLSYSLQAGNSVAMLLDQYFGTDAVLKQSVISYLFQFAKNNGAKVGGGYQTEAGKKELLTTGANPGITQSIGRRNAAGSANVSAYTSGGVLGIQGANDMITSFTTLATAMMPLMESLVTATTFSQTLGGAGNGTGGILIKGLIDATKGAADISLEGIKAIKYVALAAAVALGVGAVARNGTQMQDEYWADLIGQGKLTPNSAGPGYSTDPNWSDHQGTGGTGRTWLPGATNPNVGGMPDAGGNPTGGGGGTPTAIPTPTATPKPGDLKNQKIHPKGFKQSNDSILGWAGKVLKGIGAPVTGSNLAAMLSWVNAESSSNNNYQTWNNPLNTTRADATSISKNYVGVQEFATEEAGIAATIATLQQDNFKDITNVLKKDKGLEALNVAVKADEWGTEKIGIARNITINVNGAQDTVGIVEAIKQYLADEAIKDEARGSGYRR